MDDLSPKFYKPSLTVADRWETLALLAEKIAGGKSREYAELRRMTAALDGVSVMGVLDLNNPCIRLRNACAKASFAVSPQDFFASMVAQASAVRRLKAEAYGDAD